MQEDGLVIPILIKYLPFKNFNNYKWFKDKLFYAISSYHVLHKEPEKHV